MSYYDLRKIFCAPMISLMLMFLEGFDGVNKQYEKRLSEGAQAITSLDLDEDNDQTGQQLINQMDSLDISKSGEQSQRRSPLPFSRYSPGMARKSFGKLGKDF
uniref:Uncharacterized protein n=1 Tax=Meloidogyne incognita TaxID=6306 RepID=A0A914NAF6_MELIC